ncbi:MAG TPA: hypothetical protein VFR81_25285 [Longimicrobium sp.]|nr:hypothetical protein [Longimicrobium sp.]
MMDADDCRVISAAGWMVAVARRAVEDYAGPRAPVRTDQVGALLAAAGCHVEIFPFRSDTVAMTLPRCAGVYPVLVNRSAERTDRFFALRHEVAHVLAGDVEGAVYLAHEGYADHAERVADLFALADLVPGWWIAGLRRGGAPWREVRGEVADAIAAYAEAWPPERLRDRAALRIRLFHERGI